MMWIIYAILSTISSSLMIITMKMGLKNIDSNLGLFIRTCFVVVYLGMFIVVTGKVKEVKSFDNNIWRLLVIASVLTFSTWTFYFLALKNGKTNVVSAIDKSGVIITILINTIFFHEKLTFNLIIGILFFLVGTFFIINNY